MTFVAGRAAVVWSVCIAIWSPHSVACPCLQGVQHASRCTSAGCRFTGPASVGSDGTNGKRRPQDIPAFSSPRRVWRPQHTAPNPEGTYCEFGVFRIFHLLWTGAEVGFWSQLLAPHVFPPSVLLFLLHLCIVVYWGGVRLSPLGTLATNRPIVPALHDRWTIERLIEWELAGETEVLGESVLQCHFVHHKSHMTSWDRTRAATVGSRQLTARAMGQPFSR
jgi:hypothetical protein